jgi:DNA-binding transcriptional LysR family regulator
MDPDRLRLFLQIVDAGSMSAAARSVHLTQPAMSRNLQQLETQIGAPLFDRRGRHLALTAAGRALVPRARALLGSIDRAVREVNRCAEREYFDVRLGTVDSVATFLVPRLVEGLRAELPDLVIRFSTARTAALLDRARAGELDLVVVAHSGPPADVESLRIARYHLQYYGRKDRFPELVRARTDGELRRFPLVEIQPAPGASGRVPDDALSYAVASNVATVKALVMAGFGVGDLPDFMLSRDEAARLVRARVPHDPQCGLFLASAPDWRGPVERRVAEVIARTLRAALGARG